LKAKDENCVKKDPIFDYKSKERSFFVKFLQFFPTFSLFRPFLGAKKRLAHRRFFFISFMKRIFCAKKLILTR
jgi:hypothetical protein